MTDFDLNWTPLQGGKEYLIRHLEDGSYMLVRITDPSTGKKRTYSMALDPETIPAPRWVRMGMNINEWMKRTGYTHFSVGERFLTVFTVGQCDQCDGLVMGPNSMKMRGPSPQEMEAAGFVWMARPPSEEVVPLDDGGYGCTYCCGI